MDSAQRGAIYAFFSRMFQKEQDSASLQSFRENPRLLEFLGVGAAEWFLGKSDEELLDELGADFATLFLTNSLPVESIVLEEKEEIATGLGNPAVFFYRKYGYDFDFNKTKIQTPDHISIELGFMQNLVLKDEFEAQKEFLQNLIGWAIPYLVATSQAANTPFYASLCEAAAEFLVSDYDLSASKVGENG